jgi:hypothetical protein
MQTEHTAILLVVSVILLSGCVSNASETEPESMQESSCNLSTDINVDVRVNAEVSEGDVNLEIFNAGAQQITVTNILLGSQNRTVSESISPGSAANFSFSSDSPCSEANLTVMYDTGVISDLEVSGKIYPF